MGFLDDALKRAGESLYDRRWNWRTWLSQYTRGDYLNITSRDQIINPEEILSNGHWSTSSDSIAEYNMALEALRNIQRQQEAAYQEYYNSPLSQAQRDHVAGLNPDILGLSGSQSAEAGVGQSQPFNGLPTQEELSLQKRQLRLQSFTNIISALSTVTSLATAFTTIPFNLQQAKNAKKLGEQIDLQNAGIGLQNAGLGLQNAGYGLQNEAANIANQAAYGASMATDIAGLLSAAQQKHLDSGSSEAFDLDGWFANDANFSSLEAIYGGSPRYASTLAHQRKAVLEHQRNAAISQKDLAENTYGLGEIVSSPYYSPDQKLTMIQLKPFAQACAAADKAEAELRSTLADIRSNYSKGLDIDTAIDVANRTAEYQADYYSVAEGALVAAYEQYLRDISKPGLTLESSINEAYLDMFNSDPAGEAAWKAAYLYGSNGGSSWSEAYLLRHDEKFDKIISSEIAQAQATGEFAKLQALSNALSNLISGYDNTTFIESRPTYLEHFDKYLRRIEKVLNESGYDVDLEN